LHIPCINREITNIETKIFKLFLTAPVSETDSFCHITKLKVRNRPIVEEKRRIKNICKEGASKNKNTKKGEKTSPIKRRKNGTPSIDGKKFLNSNEPSRDAE